MTQIERMITDYIVKPAFFFRFVYCKRRITVLGLTIMILTSCDHSKIQSVDLLFVHWSATSSATIDCDLFEWAFKAILQEKTISDRSVLNEFKILINDLEIDDNLFVINDTRIKCLIHYQNHTDTLCISLCNRIFLNGQLKKDNQDLTAFIEKRIGW